MTRVGVLGGISPQATIDFEARVHRVSQRFVPQHWNAGYPPMVVLRSRAVEGIVLGCTEIPLLLPDGGEGGDLINPAALLTEAAVRFSMAV